MTASRIIHEIYVGDLEDAKNWDGSILCVLEKVPEDEPKTAGLIPILRSAMPNIKATSEEDMIGTDAIAMIPNLELIAHVIQNHIDAKAKLLVHCMMGMERSPLAMTWYMHERLGMGLMDAFDYVKGKRPQALNRVQWLNSTYDKM